MTFIRFTPEEDSLILSLHRAGKSSRFIGTQVSRSHTSVNYRIHWLHLSPEEHAARRARENERRKGYKRQDAYYKLKEAPKEPRKIILPFARPDWFIEPPPTQMAAPKQFLGAARPTKLSLLL